MRLPASAAIPTSSIKAATRELGRVDRAKRELKLFTETNEKMTTKIMKSRWNRFEIAFNKENRPEMAACERDWRKKTSEMGGLEEMGKTASSAQESAEEVDAQTFLQRFAKKTSSKKGSFGVVPSFWEEARRSQTDAETKKRADPARKSPLKSTKSANFNKSTFETKECPFPRRLRTFRSSEPPRRFDDPRKD